MLEFNSAIQFIKQYASAAACLKALFKLELEINCCRSLLFPQFEIFLFVLSKNCKAGALRLTWDFRQ